MIVQGRGQIQLRSGHNLLAVARMVSGEEMTPWTKILTTAGIGIIRAIPGLHHPGEERVRMMTVTGTDHSKAIMTTRNHTGEATIAAMELDDDDDYSNAGRSLCK